MGRPMETKLPGIKGGHQIITENCREIHTDEHVFDEATKRLKYEWEKYKEAWPKGTKFHVVFTIEPPKKEERDG